jgi:hypothetical protein
VATSLPDRRSTADDQHPGAAPGQQGRSAATRTAPTTRATGRIGSMCRTRTSQASISDGTRDSDAWHRTTGPPHTSTVSPGRQLSTTALRRRLARRSQRTRRTPGAADQHSRNTRTLPRPSSPASVTGKPSGTGDQLPGGAARPTSGSGGPPHRRPPAGARAIGASRPCRPRRTGTRPPARQRTCRESSLPIRAAEALPRVFVRTVRPSAK